MRVRLIGFPHSDISDSCGCTHLIRAFRSVPRPSSAPDAKASPVCPYSLWLVLRGRCQALQWFLACDTGRLLLLPIDLVTCRDVSCDNASTLSPNCFRTVKDQCPGISPAHRLCVTLLLRQRIRLLRCGTCTLASAALLRATGPVGVHFWNPALRVTLLLAPLDPTTRRPVHLRQKRPDILVGSHGCVKTTHLRRCCRLRTAYAVLTTSHAVVKCCSYVCLLTSNAFTTVYRTHWLSSRPQFEIRIASGDEGTRTHDLRLAKAPLSQLSYIPS